MSTGGGWDVRAASALLINYSNSRVTDGAVTKMSTLLPLTPKLVSDNGEQFETDYGDPTGGAGQHNEEEADRDFAVLERQRCRSICPSDRIE